LISKKNITTTINNKEMAADFAAWVKQLPFRDNGPSMNPLHAAIALNDLRTLRTKMDLFSKNSEQVAHFLQGHPKVEKVNYLGLKSHPLHDLASRYMILADSDCDFGTPINRYGHLMSFTVRGGAEAAYRVFDEFQMIWRATDLGRVKSTATIPAISTHQQQGEAARKSADIPPNLIRLNVGGEHPDDIIADLDRGLNKA
jgi:O-acetylhomoserine/O-acetylserine sulfhydrylase-like pyridoxal-dependent enzyme